MGRPALNLDPEIIVRLPKGMTKQIDALTKAEAVAAKEGNVKYKRSQFIREAVERELKRRGKALER